VGNIRTAIFNWLFARKEGGTFIARLEDTDRDPERYKPENIQYIEESLEFLGIVPDEWWRNRDHSGYVQSERLPLYQAAAQQLIDQGAAYPCFCTTERLAEMRAEQQTRGVPSGYDRRCRRLSPEDRARYIA
jgi:glutamyl/glutaminyl-tRNA synthetase